MSLINDETPCFVETQQGVSIKYKQKFLYSKYNPSRNIESYISNLEILPGTIFLCFSPVLDYGIKSLLNKLPNNCLLFLCETDSKLRNIVSSYYNNQFLSEENIIFPSVKELYELPIILNQKIYNFSDNKKIISGFYKRVIRIDFSSGTQFNQDFYNQLEIKSINAIKTFWVNRVTLTKFGRKYSHNLFRNLCYFPNATPIQNFFNSINKPIIICGAGESLNNGIEDFKKSKDSYYILAVDTAANFLIKNNIIPDGIFIEEAQNIILESFFDVNKYDTCHIFAGLSSLPNINHYVNNKSQISYFFTEYSNCDFITSLQENIPFPPTNPPFGSVGLTTVHYALKFRYSEDIPIYIYGLDFAYSTGITHVKNSIAYKNRLIANNKIKKIANYSASFINSLKINDKTYTTYTLNNYATLFKEYFSQSKNLFDSRNFGIPLNLCSSKPKPAINLKTNTISSLLEKHQLNTKIIKYISEEILALKALRNIFTNKSTEYQEKSQQEIESIIFNLLYKREYLYLHFIDGYQLSLNLDFLKRIRIEIDYYLREFELILESLD